MTSNNLNDYRVDLDGLRGIAVIFVVLYHFFPNLVPHGFIGLDIFFVLSGYLITSIMTQKFNQQSFNLFHFWLNRAKRILIPSFLTLFLVTLFAYFSFYPSEWLDYKYFLKATSGIHANIALLSDQGYFSTYIVRRPLMHYWSLSVEEQFYFLYPLGFFAYFWIIAKCTKSKKKITKDIWGIFFFIPLIVVSLYYFGSSEKFYLSLRTRVWEMVLGGGISLFVPFTQKALPKSKDNILTFLFYIFIIIALVGVDDKRIVIYLGALATAFYIIAHSKTRFKSPFFTFPLLPLGLISYSLYLWHWPAFSLSKILIGNITVMDKVILIVLSILLATSSYLLVEKPLKKINLKFSHESFRKHKNVSFLVIAVVMAQIGLFLKATDLNEFPKTSKLYNGKPIKLIKTKNEDLGFERTCPFIFTAEMPEFCMHHNKNAHISGTKNIMVGDSHAHSIIAAWPGYAPQLGVWELSSTSGCPPFSVKSEKYTCQNKYHDLRRLIQKGDKKFDRAFFTMAYREFSRVEKKLYENFENIVKETKIFVENVKEFYLIAPTPEVVPLLEACIYKRYPFETSLNDAHKCKISKKSWRTKSQKQVSFYQDLQKRIPKIMIIDPTDGLCDKDFCHATRKNTALYYDSDHLTYEGSLEAVKFLTPLILK